MQQEELLLGLRGQSKWFQIQIQDIARKASIHRDEYLKVEEKIVSKEKKLHHARKHYPPSIYLHTPIGGIECELDKLNLRLKDLEKQILRCQTQVETMEEAYKENEKDIVHAQNSLSPLLSLPVELHRYIFKLCQAPPYASQPIWYPLGDGKNGHVPPIQVLISQVSTRLRDIVHDSPELWTDIKVDISKEGSLAKLRGCLNRSATYTINVTFYATAEYMSKEQVHLAWAPLIPHICRIGALELNFRENDALVLILEHLKHECAPRLTAFKAQCSTESFSVQNRILYDHFIEPFECFLEGPGPALESLECKQVLPGVTSWNSGVLRLHVKMPLISRKTDYWLSESVLASFSGLLALSVDEWLWRRYWPTTSLKSFTLPHLRYLKIKTTPNTTLSLKYFFEVVTMPKLESLSVLCCFGIDVANLFYTLSHSTRQEFPSLRMLSFLCPNSVVPMDRDFLTRWACREKNTCISNPFKHVEQVAFVGLYRTNEMLAHLFSRDIYCIPRLPNIKLLSAGANDLKVETLQSIINSRIIDGCPIPRIEINESFISPLWGPDIQRFFRTNVKLYKFDIKTFTERVESVCFPPLEKLKQLYVH